MVIGEGAKRSAKNGQRTGRPGTPWGGTLEASGDAFKRLFPLFAALPLTLPAEPSPHSDLPRAGALDVLVVLGCRVLDDGRPGAALRRRVERAAELFRAGVAPRVVMSGGRRWGDRVEADVMLDHWLDLGLSAEAVLLERCSLTTRGNARCSAELLRGHGLTRLGLVTCDYHLARARRHFAAAGLSVQGYSARFHRSPSRRLWLWTRELGARLLEPLAKRPSLHALQTPHPPCRRSDLHP